jgi:hypothetical protein
MEGLLSALAANLARVPGNVLKNSNFQLKTRHVISPMLTLTENGQLFEADWDDTSGILVKGECLNPYEKVHVQSDGSNISVRIGENGGWQEVVFYALSTEVMRWLVQNSETGRQMCLSGMIADDDICEKSYLEREHALLQQLPHPQEEEGRFEGPAPRGIHEHERLKRNEEPVAVKETPADAPTATGQTGWSKVLLTVLALVATAAVIGLGAFLFMRYKRNVDGDFVVYNNHQIQPQGSRAFETYTERTAPRVNRRSALDEMPYVQL